MNPCFGRLVLAMLVAAVLSCPASAETTAGIVSKWGLIGSWAVDCSIPPDHDRGAVFDYETTPTGGVVHRRDFGDIKDESEVLSARISRDGMLNLRVFFPSLRQTREFGLMMQSDDTLRAMYNRNEKKQYTIRNGRFTASGKPTPLQHRCEKPVS